MAILSSASGCTGVKEKTASGQKTDLGSAAWITDDRELPVADSLMYGEIPAPLFRKAFTLEKNVRSATLFITAAGYYDAYVNGKPVGVNYLDPAWTNYSKRIYYAEYDLTADLRPGENVIGASLGNGFYNPLPLKMWGNINLRNFLPTGKPAFIARLRIEYENGDTLQICTDKSWKYSYGPIRKNNVYIGEIYNAGMDIAGWKQSGFNDSLWNESVQSNGPGGKLIKAFFPHIRKRESVSPVRITSPSKNIYLLDMGVNLTGTYRIRLKGQKDDTVTFRFGERLYEDGTLNPMTQVAGQIKRKGMGGPGAPDVAWQTDSFVFGDSTEAVYSPLFTFHIFRYMEIAGLKYKPELTDIEMIAFNTEVEKAGSFTCSSELINSIQTATERTFLDNLIGVQSDCPGRERFGYGGDLNATSEAFISNFGMHDFYRKAIYDYIDALQDTIFADTAPYVGIKICGPSWESAFLITQYKLLVYYNDTSIIKELYQNDLGWMAKVERLFPSGIIDKGLSDHESLIKVPVQLIGTSHYLECARIMKIFAGIMDDAANEKKFDGLATKLQGLIKERFWDKVVTDTINKQTLFATLLYHNIIPENDRKAAVDSLLETLKSAPASHFTTGIFGTKYILEELSEEGHADEVFKIVNSKAWPGWGYMLDRGATTIWETWKESDNVYSNCHPMFGTVSEWFYRWLGGIRPDPAYPGFERFTIAPALPDGLDFVKCSYKSPYGEIVSNWNNKNKNHPQFEITVPKGTTAAVSLPSVKKLTVKESKGESFSPSTKEGNKTVFDLKPGEYLISVIP